MGKVAGLVLAGGQSSRMGEDKAELIRSGQSMLQFSQALLADAGIRDVFISRNESGDKQQVIKDVIENRGPLAGIYSALLHIKEVGKYDAVLIVAVDMPLLNVDLIKQLMVHGNQSTSACSQEKSLRPACFADNFFPLYLPINQAVIDYLKAQIFNDDGNLKVKWLIKAFDGDFIDHQHHRALMNTNTPQQWQQSQQQLAERG